MRRIDGTRHHRLAEAGPCAVCGKPLRTGDPVLIHVMDRRGPVASHAPCAFYGTHPHGGRGLKLHVSSPETLPPAEAASRLAQGEAVFVKIAAAMESYGNGEARKVLDDVLRGEVAAFCGLTEADHDPIARANAVHDPQDLAWVDEDGRKSGDWRTRPLSEPEIAKLEARLKGAAASTLAAIRAESTGVPIALTVYVAKNRRSEHLAVIPLFPVGWRYQTLGSFVGSPDARADVDSDAFDAVARRAHDAEGPSQPDDEIAKGHACAWCGKPFVPGDPISGHAKACDSRCGSFDHLACQIARLEGVVPARAMVWNHDARGLQPEERRRRVTSARRVADEIWKAIDAAGRRPGDWGAAKKRHHLMSAKLPPLLEKIGSEGLPQAQAVAAASSGWMKLYGPPKDGRPSVPADGAPIPDDLGMDGGVRLPRLLGGAPPPEIAHRDRLPAIKAPEEVEEDA